jgi:hypothetical protein
MTMMLFQSIVFSQICPAPVVPPADLVNVVVNPGFESGLIAPGDAGPHNLVTCCSSPGSYMISNLSNNFNAGMIQGVTPHSGNDMLLIDGIEASNATAWEQTVTVQPNKMYYFSAWLTALSSTEKCQMVFQVQPVAPTAGTALNISTYFIPPNGPVWQQEFGTWFSGTTTTVTIRLIDTNPLALGSAGNDYAIDDIMFRPSCVGTTAGPQPNLGPSVLGICNSGGQVDLNSNVPNTAGNIYTWFRNGSTVANVTTPDILEAQNTVGMYVVCVDSAGCVKSDSVQLQAALSLDLGPDANLCSPAFKLLDTRITNPSSFTIKWYKNGVLIAGATGTTYMATAAGTYSVTVTDGASCNGTDAVTITSQTDQTVGAFYCPPTSTATVSVINAGGTYNWYNVATGGSSLGSGLTYTATGLVAPGPYIYYLENSNFVTSGAGLLNAASSYLGPDNPPLYGPNNVDAQNQMIFSANTNTTLTSVTVLLDMNANYAGNVTVTLTDQTVPSTLISTYPVSNNPGAAATISYPIPLALALTAGHTYSLSIVGVNGSSFAHRYTGANISTYFPATYTAVTMISGQANTIYPGLFNWQFSSASTCDRTPAYIVDNCPAPITLINFNAVYTNSNTVTLQWSTASEVNNNYFTIQRSTDGVHFTDVKDVPGAGNSGVVNLYNAEDNDALDGVSYYRIKQTDFDGHSTYSPIVDVTSPGTEFSFNLAPNLCNAGTEIKINIRGAVANQKIPIEIIDMLGRNVYHKILNSDEGGNVFDVIDLYGSALTSGTYVVIVSPYSNKQYMQKLVFMN